MGILTNAAPIVVFAFLLGVAVSVMTFLMLMTSIVMRMNALRMERIDARAEALWRPIILTTQTGTVADLPRLAARDVLGFIQVWNEAHEPLHGGTTDRLARIAREVELERHLSRFLEATIFHHRLVAVIALGHIESDESFNRVLPHLDDKNPIMSLCAARSLMQIDPARAVPKLIPLIEQRSYRSQGVVATILRATDGAVVSEPLADPRLHATSDIAPRMIRFLAGVNPECAAPIIRKALHSSADESIISTCLQAMTNPGDLDCVRPLLSHPVWCIRMQAATTLGNLGGPGDEQRLTALLSDSQWWVRYRAAQALLKLSFIGVEDARQIRQAQTDAYARDIIDHVQAERTIKAAS